MLMSDAERKLRAEERRGRMVITRCDLEDSDIDPNPTFGAEAISLAAVLTRESWSMSGRPLPDYSRAKTPYKFVKYPLSD